MYREPHESTTVNQAELDYIAAGGGLAPPSSAGKSGFSWARVRALLGYRQMWGACLGQFGGNSTLVFFLTWFPTYLATERQMGWIKIGFFAVMPFIAAAVGVMFGGWLSDELLKRTGSANIARKLPIIAGLLGASTIILANYVDSDAAVIAILSVAFFAQGMTGLGWTLISDIAPKNLMGLTGGVFNFAANLAGIVTPLVIGFIVAADRIVLLRARLRRRGGPDRRGVVHLRARRREAHRARVESVRRLGFHCEFRFRFRQRHDAGQCVRFRRFGTRELDAIQARVDAVLRQQLGDACRPRPLRPGSGRRCGPRARWSRGGGR